MATESEDFSDLEDHLDNVLGPDFVELYPGQHVLDDDLDDRVLDDDLEDLDNSMETRALDDLDEEHGQSAIPSGDPSAGFFSQQLLMKTPKPEKENVSPESQQGPASGTAAMLFTMLCTTAAGAVQSSVPSWMDSTEGRTTAKDPKKTPFRGVAQTTPGRWGAKFDRPRIDVSTGWVTGRNTTCATPREAAHVYDRHLRQRSELPNGHQKYISQKKYAQLRNFSPDGTIFENPWGYSVVEIRRIFSFHHDCYPAGADFETGRCLQEMYHPDGTLRTQKNAGRSENQRRRGKSQRHPQQEPPTAQVGTDGVTPLGTEQAPQPKRQRRAPQAQPLTPEGMRQALHAQQMMLQDQLRGDADGNQFRSLATNQPASATTVIPASSSSPSSSSSSPAVQSYFKRGFLRLIASVAARGSIVGVSARLAFVMLLACCGAMLTVNDAQWFANPTMLCSSNEHVAVALVCGWLALVIAVRSRTSPPQAPAAAAAEKGLKGGVQFEQAAAAC
jgi:hypothetical protein